jgi:hypothetical protein
LSVQSLERYSIRKAGTIMTRCTLDWYYFQQLCDIWTVWRRQRVVAWKNTGRLWSAKANFLRAAIRGAQRELSQPSEDLLGGPSGGGRCGDSQAWHVQSEREAAGEDFFFISV